LEKGAALIIVYGVYRWMAKRVAFRNDYCLACGETRRGFKWAGLFILMLFAAVSWAMPVEPDFVAGSWIFRIAAPVGAILTLVHLLRTKKEPTLKARLATIQPAADNVCPFCGAQLLMLGSQCSCPGCGVVRS